MAHSDFPALQAAEKGGTASKEPEKHPAAAEQVAEKLRNSV
jgi:hypothetical protein